MKRKRLWIGIVICGIILIIVGGGLYVLRLIFGDEVFPPMNCFVINQLSPTLIATPSQNIDLNLQIEEIQTIRVSLKPILYLAYNHDGSKLAAATNEQVWVFNSNYTEPVELKDSQMKLIQGLAFNPINDQLAVFDRHISIWDTETYQIIEHIEDGAVAGIVFTRDGKQLVSSNTVTGVNSDDRQLQVWNTKSYSKERNIEYPHLVEYFAITPFGNCAVVKQSMADTTGGSDMALVDFSTGGWRLFDEQNEGVYQVQVSTDGETTAGFTRTGLSLWNTHSGKRIATSIESHAYNGVFYEQDRYLIVLDSLPNNGVFKESIRLIEVESGQEITAISRTKPDLTNIVIHPNGKNFATSTNDGQIVLWSIHQ